MERVLRPAQAATVTDALDGVLAPDQEVFLNWSDAWRRVVPLWRHAVWFLGVFAVLAAAVAVRLDVQQLHKSLDRNARAQREAEVLNDRLRLEFDARTRATAMEAAAASLQLGPQAKVRQVRVR